MSNALKSSFVNFQIFFYKYQNYVIKKLFIESNFKGTSLSHILLYYILKTKYKKNISSTLFSFNFRIKAQDNKQDLCPNYSCLFKCYDE